jgi:two-component system nitrogen regulation response regulator GlnG/two-component system response regulator HydG
VPEPAGAAAPGAGSIPALAVAWSVLEPERAGEVILLDRAAMRAEPVLGRHDGDHDYGGRPFLVPCRQRPGETVETGPLELPAHVSRIQLAVGPGHDGRVRLTNAGKASVVVGAASRLAAGQSVEIHPGDTVLIAEHLLLVAVERPARLPAARFFPPALAPGFGQPDGFGIAGESPAIWELRDRVAFAAQLGQHVIVHGPSGSGKELVARAVHRLSARGKRRLVAHSAADIPPTLIEAELFGNRADYPNPGTPGREGLIGQAHQSTLFLDELGTLPVELQPKLLRVLDCDGEYRRLGVDEVQRADFLLVAATNRPLGDLKPDLLARLKVVIPVPGLDERREDVPLLIRELLARMAPGRPGVSPAADAGAGKAAPLPALDPALVGALVRHRYQLHVRELEQLLFLAVYGSRGERIELVPGVAERLRREAPPPAAANPEGVPCAAVAAALEAHGWNIGETAQALGWSRFQLNRKIKKCGLERPPGAGGAAAD